MKKRKLGIRFRKQQAREWGWAMPTKDAAELYDIETGEAFEGVCSIELMIAPNDGAKVTAHVEIFVAAIDSYERPEEHLLPVKD